MVTFQKCQNEAIEGFNYKNVLGVKISKSGCGYSKRHADSRWLVRVIEYQGGAIVGLKK